MGPWIKRTIEAIRHGLPPLQNRDGQELVVHPTQSRESDRAESHRLAAMAAQENGDHETAAGHFRTSLQLAPAQPAVWAAWCALLVNQGKWEDALAIAADGLRHFPGNTILQLYMGNLCYQLNRIEEAVRHLEQAAATSPGDPAILSNLGLAQLIDNQAGAAAATLERALPLAPDSVDVRLTLGRARMELGDLPGAKQCFERALALDPEHVVARYNLGHLALLRGDFAAGWDGFSYRARQPGQVPHLEFPKPLWDGQADLSGKTILLYAEQGYGDTLQFIRYAIPVSALGARVIVAVPAPLLTLAQGCSGVDVAIDLAWVQQAPPFDFYLPMLSLPKVFATGMQTIPAGIPYLHCRPERLQHWHDLLGPSRQLRVGLVWSGGAHKQTHQSLHADRMRSMHFDQILPFFDVPGTQYHSLQIGDDAQSQARGHAALIDHTAELFDFHETAALIEQLDLVISVDTAVAHLAGALGKPVWLLNRYNSCWRWQLERSDSPWYPAMRIFRQPARGDWDSAIAEVRTALGEHVRHAGRHI